MTSLQERLFAMQDKQYAAFQAKLTPGDDGSLVLCHRPCQAMGPGDSLHRATPPCSMDAQQDHPEGYRELQNHA